MSRFWAAQSSSSESGSSSDDSSGSDSSVAEVQVKNKWAALSSSDGAYQLSNFSDGTI